MYIGLYSLRLVFSESYCDPMHLFIAAIFEIGLIYDYCLFIINCFCSSELTDAFNYMIACTLLTLLTIQQMTGIFIC